MAERSAITPNGLHYGDAYYKLSPDLPKVESQTVNKISRGVVCRFDTVVFNYETNVLQVWRYREGLYPGNHELVFSVVAEWIKGDLTFRGVVRLIQNVSGLHGFSEEYDLPTPWKGYRFI